MLDHSLGTKSALRTLRYLAVKRQRVLFTPTAINHTLFILKKTASIFFTRRLAKVTVERLYFFKKQSCLSSLMLKNISHTCIVCNDATEQRPYNNLLYINTSTNNTLLFASALNILLNKPTEQTILQIASSFVQARVYANVRYSFLNKQLSYIFKNAFRGLKRFYVYKHGRYGKPLHKTYTFSQRLRKYKMLNAARKFKKINKKLKNHELYYFRQLGHRKLARHLTALTQLGYSYEDPYFLMNSGNFFRLSDKLFSCIWLDYNVILKLSEVISKDPYIGAGMLMFFVMGAGYPSLSDNNLGISRLRSSKQFPIIELSVVYSAYKASYITIKRSHLLV